MDVEYFYNALNLIAAVFLCHVAADITDLVRIFLVVDGASEILAGMILQESEQPFDTACAMKGRYRRWIPYTLGWSVYIRPTVVVIST